MPSGYLVVLGDGSLDPADAIVDGPTTFTSQVRLGAGVWVWSGIFGAKAYTGTQEPGGYHLATDGNVYFVPDYGRVDTITSASVVSAPGYADDPTDNQVDSTDDADGVDATYRDAQADQVDDGSGFRPGGLGGGAAVRGGSGDDVFVINTRAQDGVGITIAGGDAGKVAGDTLDRSGLRVKGSIVFPNTDASAGGVSGTAPSIAGTFVTSSAIETVICFASGTQILTPRGERPIETLRRGDMVNTLDHGPRPIKWIGKKTVRATGALAPVCFQRGSVGNNRVLYVSPQHRMLKSGYETRLHFGEEEVLAPARSLVDNLSISIAYGGMITYYHMLFDDHEIVFANGTASESFHPGGHGLDTLHPPAREELFSLFPALRTDPNGFGPTSRPSLRPGDAEVFANISAA